MPKARRWRLIMSVKTQGTNLYCMNPEDGEVVDVGCVTAISGIDSTLEEIETTCLSANSRTYESGLDTPGTANFTTQFDPEDTVHIKLFNWKKLGKTLAWAVGFRQQDAIDDGVDPDEPDSTTDSSGDYIFDLPDTRSWIVFEGYMNSHPFDFQGNAVVTSNIGVRISGDIDVVPRTAS